MATARPDSARTARRPQLAPLTSLRFVAAMMVFAYHLFPPVSGETRLLDYGNSGVAFFFVLSGFVLAYNYADRFMALHGVEVVRFYAARVARIWPLTLFVLACALPLIVVNPPAGDFSAGEWTAAVALGALNLQQAFAIPALPNLNPPAWSLSVEVVAYAAMPLVLWLLAGFGRVRSRTLVLAGLAVWGSAMAFGWALSGWASAGVLQTHVPLRLADVFIGVLLGLLFLRHGAAGLPLAGRTVVAAWTLAELASIGAIVATAALAPSFPVGILPGAAWMPAYGLAIWVFACGRGAISRALSVPSALLAGEISFGVYLWHMVVISYLRAPALASSVDSRVLLAATVAVTLGVSWLSYRLVEVPARRRIRAAAARRIERHAVAGDALPDGRAAVPPPARRAA